MNLFLLAILGIFIFPTSLFAQTACRIQTPQIGESSSRSRQIIFPDGREIIVVGHTHGDRQLPQTLNQLINDKSLSTEELNATLQTLAQSNSNAIRQVFHDRETLKSLIIENPKFKFIAFESTEEIAQNNLEQYALLQNNFIKMLEQRKITHRDGYDLISLALGPIASLKIDEPNLSFSVRGFESESATRDYNKAASEVENILTQLKTVAASNKKFLDDVSSTDYHLWSFYDNYDPKEDSKFLSSLENDKIPQAYRSLTVEWVKLRLREMHTLKLREQAVIENMLSQNQSGILVIGSKHLNSIADGISKYCLRSNTH